MYPVFLKLEGIKCLVVGGGQVGERKARRLVEEKAKVYLISREISRWFSEAINSGDVVWIAKEYSPKFLRDVSIVFAATDDKDLNSLVVSDALKLGLWCNSATNPQEGNLTLPAVFQKGKLAIAVSTGGASPALASLIRDEISNHFRYNWEDLLDCIEELRKAIQSLDKQYPEKNQKLFRKIASLVFQEFKNGTELNTVREHIKVLLSQELSDEEFVRVKQVLIQC